MEKELNKSDIRKKILSIRSGISEDQQKENSIHIGHTFFSLDYVKNARLFYFYMGYEKEVITRDMIQKILNQEKRVALPRIDMTQGFRMEFCEINSLLDVKMGYKGIPEPYGIKELTDIPDIMVMPGVAFDCNRNRIGYGKGFYDRYLGCLAKQNTIYKIAFAYECQIVEKIDADEFDVKPDMIITEKRIIC